jgi:hypothetical protein
MTSQFTKEKSTYTLQSKGHDKSKARTQGGASKQDHQTAEPEKVFPPKIQLKRLKRAKE